MTRIRREIIKEDLEESQRYRQIVVCVGDNESPYPRRTFAVFKPRDNITLHKAELSVAEDVAADTTNYEHLQLIGSGSNVVVEMYSSGSWTKGVPKDMGTLNSTYTNIVAGDTVQLNLGTGSGGANKTLRGLTVHLTYSLD
ncbi:MAG: hypothetical protein N2V75_00070 [Methanophagales archaeon]|nr:hypothetical protein [Methanophagales archaeon]